MKSDSSRLETLGIAVKGLVNQTEKFVIRNLAATNPFSIPEPFLHIMEDEGV
jgi:hypothetical protein